MPAAIPAIISLAGAGYQAYQSGRNAKKAKELAGQPRPNYEIPQPEYDNLALAQSMAGQGLDAYTRQNFQNNSNAGLSAAIGGVLRGGGDPNAVSSAYGTYQAGQNQLAVADSQQKLRNLYGLMAQRDKMSDSLDKSFQVNNYAPWADKQALAAELRKTSQQQQSSAIQGATAAAGSFTSGLAQQNTINKVGQMGGGGAPTPSGGGGGAFGAGLSSPESYAYSQLIGNGAVPQPSGLGGSGGGSFGAGLSSPDSYAYSQLIGTGMGGSDFTKVYNPSTNTYSTGIDWSRVNPQSRQSMYRIINQGYNGTY